MSASIAFRHLSCALVLLAAAAPMLAADAPAQGQASACDSALEAMHAVEQRLVAEADQGRTPDPKAKAELQRLQKQAARACLGGTGERQPPPQSVLQPAVRVPPPQVLSPAPAPVPRLPPPATVSPPPPVVAPPAPPVTTTSCNPSGCWNSEGQFMPRVGPALSSPRGLCTVQPGGVVHCP